MRIHFSGTRQHLRLAAAALIGPALALAPLSAPAFADSKTVDATLAISGASKAAPGDTVGFTFTASATAPATGYQLAITAPRGAKLWEYEAQTGWQCAIGGEYDVFCEYPLAATTKPKPITVAWVLPKKPGKVAITAKVKTAEPDSNDANNTATHRVTLAPKPTPGHRTVSVQGRIWNDADKDGRQDASEKNVAGAKVKLLTFHGDSMQETRSATTGKDGRYSFAGLPVQDAVSGYRLLVATPDTDWRFTKADVGAERGDSDLKRAPADEPQVGGFHQYFPKGSIVGFAEPLRIKAGKTAVVDGGLVKDDAGGGETLPVTGPRAQGLAAGGGLLLLGGVALTVLARRRRFADAPA
jgi:hypothetical protein